MAWDDRLSWADSPFNRLRRLQGEMDRIFGPVQGELETFPAVNIWSDREQIVVTAELPGMDPDSIGITTKGDLLTLQGERKAEPDAENIVCHRVERWSGAFSRTLRLPFDVNAEKVRAHYKNGVLAVTLPRSEESRPSKIQIQTEG